MALLAAASLLLMLVLLIGIARILVQGPFMATLILRSLPQFQGKVQLESVHWTLSGALALLRGHTASFRLDGLRVFDPEGTLVLDVPHVAIELELHRKPAAVIVNGADLGRVYWRFAAMRHKDGIGFLAALQPAPRAGTSAAPAGTTRAPPRIEVRGVRWDDLNAVFDFEPWGLELKGVRGSGWLWAGAGSPGFAFDATGVARQGGRLRIMSAPNDIELPFDDVVLPHVGVHTERPEDLYVEVRDARTGASRLHGAGYFTGLFAPGEIGRSGIDVELAFEHAADAISAVLHQRSLGAPQFSGADARLAASLHGPYSAMLASVQLSGLDLEYSGRRVRQLSVEARGSTGPPSLEVAALRFASPGGGTVEATGKLDARRGQLELHASRVALRPWLPGWLENLAADRLDGSIAVAADLRRGSVTLETLDMRLRSSQGDTRAVVLSGRRVQQRRPAPEGAMLLHLGGLRLHRGQLLVERLAFSGPAGALTLSARLGPPAGARTRIALQFAARRVDLAQLVRSPELTGRISATGTAHGTVSRLVFAAAPTSGSSLRVLGERYRLPARVDATVVDRQVLVSPVELTSAGGARLAMAGTIGLQEIDLALTLEGHPLARLPWFASAHVPLTGFLAGDLRLRGVPPRPQITGDVLLHDVVLYDVSLGDGVLHVGAQGEAMTVAGHLFDRFAVNGLLYLGPQGAEASVQLAFRDLALLPLFPALRRLPGAAALASGTLTGVARPGQLLAIDLALDAFALSYDAGGPRGSQRVQLHADEPLHGLATLQPPTLQIDLGRLRTDAGPLDVALSVSRDRLQAELRGSVDIVALQPLLGRSGQRMGGVVDVMVHASGTLQQPVLTGHLQVATPLQVDLGPRGPSTIVDAGLITLAQGDGGTELGARNVAVHIAGSGPFVVGAAGGAPARVIVHRISPLRVGLVDLPLRARNVKLNEGGLRVDDLDFDVRLQGDLRDRLALTGELAIAGAALSGKLSQGRRPGQIRLDPVLARSTVDLRIHSRDAGILIERRLVPDFRIYVDAHISGTFARPHVQYALSSPDYFGRVALELYELYQHL